MDQAASPERELGKALAEAHHVLGLLKPERRVHAMAVDIIGQRVGRKLACALRERPLLDHADKRCSHASAAEEWHDINAFQESDR